MRKEHANLVSLLADHATFYLLDLPPNSKKPILLRTHLKISATVPYGTMVPGFQILFLGGKNTHTDIKLKNMCYRKVVFQTDVHPQWGAQPDSHGSMTDFQEHWQLHSWGPNLGLRYVSVGVIVLMFWAIHLQISATKWGGLGLQYRLPARIFLYKQEGLCPPFGIWNHFVVDSFQIIIFIL